MALLIAPQEPPVQNRGRLSFFRALRRFPRAVALVLSAVVAFGTGSGCRSLVPRDGRPQVLRPGQSPDPARYELSSDEERQAEAFARFSAGLVEELDAAPEAALVHYRAAIASDPANEELVLDVVRKLVELKRLDEAKELLEKSAARKEASGLVWAWLGTLHKLKGNPQAAIVASKEAVRRTPHNLAGYQNLAQIYLEAGQIVEAVTVLEQAALQPEADSNFMLVLAGALGTLQQLKDPAVGDLRPRILGLLDRTAARNPETPADLLRLADLYQLFGEGTKSLPLYQKLLETHPDFPGLRERLAEVYIRTDNKEQAAEQFRILSLRQPTNPLPHYYLGVLALESKHYEEAIDAFNRVLVLRPDNQAIYLDLALAHLSHRRPQDALGVLDRARAKFRSSFLLEYYSAAALTDLKRHDDAIRHFTAAEVVAGATEPEQLTAQFYFQSGIAYERARRFDDAAVQFEKSIELKVDFAEALNYLGYMWAEQGLNLPRAHELIRKAVELEPDNEAFLDSLAWVLHQMGKSEEALPHQLRAVELAKEPDATLYDHLGDIYQRLGKPADAGQAWKKAQEIGATPEIAKKLESLPKP